MSSDTALPGFERFYQAQWPSTVGLAYLLIGDRDAAVDLAQEAFTVTLARWESIDEPILYLKGVVRNLAKRRSRNAARAKIGSTPPGADEALEVEDRAASKLTVLDAVRRLPPAQYEVVVLRFYADMSEADIAHVVGCRRGTVKSRLSRALDALTPLLEDA